MDNDCLDLMADLGATDDQLEFAMEHVVYASAMNGYARLDPDDGNMDMYPLLDMIIDDMPAPEVDDERPAGHAVRAPSTTPTSLAVSASAACTPAPFTRATRFWL